jgi:hypothetical protein
MGFKVGEIKILSRKTQPRKKLKSIDNFFLFSFSK